MPTNNKTTPEKAAIKRRQRAGYKEEEQIRRANYDLFKEIVKVSDHGEVAAVAKLSRKAIRTSPTLTPHVASRIVKYVLEGAMPVRAARAAGVTDAVFNLWRKKGLEAKKAAEAEFLLTEANRTEAHKIESGVDGVDDGTKLNDAEDGQNQLQNGSNQAASELSVLDFVPPDYRIFVQLMLAIETAEARSELRLLRKVAKGGRDWKAQMAILERRFSERWAKEVKTTHTVEGDADKPIVVTYESDDERALRVANILDKAGAIEGRGRPLIEEEKGR